MISCPAGLINRDWDQSVGDHDEGASDLRIVGTTGLLDKRPVNSACPRNRLGKSADMDAQTPHGSGVRFAKMVGFNDRPEAG
jgi:hypothetical protein